jgi:type IV secretory pathway VirB10-like protein
MYDAMDADVERFLRDARAAGASAPAPLADERLTAMFAASADLALSSPTRPHRAPRSRPMNRVLSSLSSKIVTGVFGAGLAIGGLGMAGVLPGPFALTSTSNETKVVAETPAEPTSPAVSAETETTEGTNTEASDPAKPAAPQDPAAPAATPAAADPCDVQHQNDGEENNNDAEPAGCAADEKAAESNDGEKNDSSEDTAEPAKSATAKSAEKKGANETSGANNQA